MSYFLTIYHNGDNSTRPIPTVILKVWGEIPEEIDCQECSSIWYSKLNKRWEEIRTPRGITKRGMTMAVEFGSSFIRKSYIGEIFRFKVSELDLNDYDTIK